MFRINQFIKWFFIFSLVFVWTFILHIILHRKNKSENRLFLYQKRSTISPEPSKNATITVSDGKWADDLKRIHGIGPRIQEILEKGGIKTFADLSECDVTYLKLMLKENGIRISNPDTWPAQAKNQLMNN